MRKLLKLAGLAALLAGTATTASSSYMPKQQESATLFYSDEEHTTQVGAEVRFCDGTFIRTGTPTLYTEELYFGCD
ncbi:DUF6289 family protein [Sphingomonas sp. HITSZ_GF]|uniref:DUF6289 family protein n=1 Tax=Sphingomonas sp. HITSZ_GF TaxID=3037247 RepID=UPI00240E747D|nr:DUF6289 family protein [Sphingomonas sp. HITSZ_GF]MDG2532842.1 DUF6289 family protein [Sphingomonas sp. HITSZ_GF]